MTSKKPFRHRVERTRNKHSRAVYRDGTIIVRLAKGLSATEEKQHIESLVRRMTEQLMNEELTKTTLDPFRKLLNGAEQCTVTLPSGKKYVFKLRAGNKLGAVRTATGWTVTVSRDTRRKGLHRLLWKLLAEAEQPRIERMVKQFNDHTLRVRYSKVRLAFATSQWGSCSPRGVIMINAALLFAPLVVLKYVIIHELSHRRRADHSPAYWKVVESAMPSYDRARNELLNYRLPSL